MRALEATGAGSTEDAVAWLFRQKESAAARAAKAAEQERVRMEQQQLVRKAQAERELELEQDREQQLQRAMALQACSGSQRLCTRRCARPAAHVPAEPRTLAAPLTSAAACVSPHP